MTASEPQSPPDLRLPAEWEGPAAVLMAWPHSGTDWADMLSEVTGCYVELVSAIADAGAPVIIVAPDTSEPLRLLAHVKGVRYVELPTNDTWTRDYGPITVTAGGKPRLLDFKFNGWGLKFASDRDNLVTSRLAANGILRADYDNCLRYVIEGGSIETDGQGTILTTSSCLIDPNRNGMSRREMENLLGQLLGARRVLWLDHGSLAGDDTDGHIDTLARFAAPHTILYVGCADSADEHYTDMTLMRHDLEALRSPAGQPYNLVELPLPRPIFDENGSRLPATYANYLVCNGRVIMPTYGQHDLDTLAARIISVATGMDVSAVDCRPLIRQHGSLHCATMQLPLEAINI